MSVPSRASQASARLRIQRADAAIMKHEHEAKLREVERMARDEELRRKREDIQVEMTRLELENERERAQIEYETVSQAGASPTPSELEVENAPGAEAQQDEALHRRIEDWRQTQVSHRFYPEGGTTQDPAAMYDIHSPARYSTPFGPQAAAYIPRHINWVDSPNNPFSTTLCSNPFGPQVTLHAPRRLEVASGTYPMISPIPSSNPFGPHATPHLPGHLEGTYDKKPHSPVFYSNSFGPMTTSPTPGPLKGTHDASEANMGSPVDFVRILHASTLSNQELARGSRLPPVKLEPFSGDITTFAKFQNSFKWNVENNTDDPTQRLTHLLNALDGTPKTLIENCFNLPAQEGYDQAWEILKKHYLKPDELCNAFVRKLMNFKEIQTGDSKGLLEFSATLTNAKTALGAQYIRLELEETITKILSKLPYTLRQRWIMKGKTHKFALPALIDYIEEQAEVTKNLNRFGSSSKPKIDGVAKPSARTTDKPMPVHHTGTAPASKKCPVCDKIGHELLKCYKFERLDVEARWAAVTKVKYCFRCLLSPHHHEVCEETIRCGKCGSNSHHTMLHKVRVTSGEDSPGSDSTTADAARPAVEVATSPIEPTAPPAPMHSVRPVAPTVGQTMLKIIPVLVNGKYQTYAFIDGGAAPTLASKSLIDRMGLRGRRCHQTMITEAGTFVSKEVLSLDIGDLDGQDKQHVRDVFVAEKINVTTNNLMPSEWLSKWPHLADVELQSLPDHYEVELIVGLNTTLNRVILEQRHGGETEPSAYRTRLGWVVFGPTGQDYGSKPIHLHHVHPADDTTELLQTHFNQDFWEKESCSAVENSIEDQFFLDKMKSSVKQIDGKYQASLPFKSNAPLPNNRKVAERRAAGLKRKFEAESEYKDAYVTQVTKYIDKGYAEPVPASQIDRADGRVNYLPHHGVLHPIKGKLRVVFDPKAKKDGTSLNEHLLQ